MFDPQFQSWAFLQSLVPWEVQTELSGIFLPHFLTFFLADVCAISGSSIINI